MTEYYTPQPIKKGKKDPNLPSPPNLENPPSPDIQSVCTTVVLYSHIEHAQTDVTGSVTHWHGNR